MRTFSADFRASQTIYETWFSWDGHSIKGLTLGKGKECVKIRGRRGPNNSCERQGEAGFMGFTVIKIKNSNNNNNSNNKNSNRHNRNNKNSNSHNRNNNSKTNSNSNSNKSNSNDN